MVWNVVVLKQDTLDSNETISNHEEPFTVLYNFKIQAQKKV